MTTLAKVIKIEQFRGAPTLTMKRGCFMENFNCNTFLTTPGNGRQNISFAKDDIVDTQGDIGNAVFYIQSGAIKLTIVNANGKEATVGLLVKGDFFGEGCMTGQKTRVHSATATSPCLIMKIDKATMVAALHDEHTLADLFVAHLLHQNARREEDLVDQLFNSCEKRLARTLLTMAHYGEPGVPQKKIESVSQEDLARIVGTTRSRVSFFMNRFRNKGYIDYSRNTTLVNPSLLNVILH